MTYKQKRNDKLEKILFGFFSCRLSFGAQMDDRDKLMHLREFQDWVTNFVVDEYWYDPENKILEADLKIKYGEDYNENLVDYIEWKEFSLRWRCVVEDVISGITKEMMKKWKNKLDLISSSGPFLEMYKKKLCTEKYEFRYSCRNELRKLIDEMKDDVKQLLFSFYTNE